MKERTKELARLAEKAGFTEIEVHLSMIEGASRLLAGMAENTTDRQLQAMLVDISMTLHILPEKVTFIPPAKGVR